MPPNAKLCKTLEKIWPHPIMTEVVAFQGLSINLEFSRPLENDFFAEILIGIALRACRVSEFRRFFLPGASCLVKKTPNSGNLDRFLSFCTMFRLLMKKS